jgi:hypothetical protein
MPDTSELDAVIERLDAVVAGAVARSSRTAIFPAMYRSVTDSVRAAIHHGGLFTDETRLQHLTVTFAGLYLDAERAWRDGGDVPRCWRLAFAVAERPGRRMILEDLLLGMNAHINYDLGIATTRVAGGRLPEVYGDFLLVNEILFAKLDGLQARLGEVSPRLALLDRLGGPWDESVMRMSIRTARDLAWRFADRLDEADDPVREMEERDGEATAVGRLIARRWSPVHLFGKFVASAETHDLAAIVGVFGGVDVDLDAVAGRASSEAARQPIPDRPLRDAVSRRPGRRSKGPSQGGGRTPERP